MPQSAPPPSRFDWARLSRRLLNVEPSEAPAVIAGLLMFFLLFTGYFMLRPVRETMGVAGGVKNLQWLFTGTFVATLAALPLFGWVASKFPRRQIVPWLFGLFALNLVGFAAALHLAPDNVWVARSFYLWLSVFNLLTISAGWSVLADVFAAGEAKRLFALIAGGASLGGLLGPLLGALWVKQIGHAGLLLVSAALLVASAAAGVWVHHWRDRHPLASVPEESDATRQRPLGGNPFTGATDTFRSPYLLGISLFVLLLTSVTTFLYFEQARLVEAAYPNRVDQTRVFGFIDTVVQALSILAQIFLTGHLARKLGLGVLLVGVPLLMVVGFLCLAVSPVFTVFVVVMVIRRAGEYAFIRPGREMLYTVIPTEQKYKAKNFIDTVVYRGGDAVSGWVKSGFEEVSKNPTAAMVFGAVLAIFWGASGWWLARAEEKLETAPGRAGGAG